MLWSRALGVNMTKGRETEEAISQALNQLDPTSFKAKMMKAFTPTGDCNTNAKAHEIRLLMEASEIEDYPSLSGLEDAWQVLSRYYGDDYDGTPLIPRVENPDRTAENPLESFKYHVEMGFYPPPEIMTVIQLCFQKYLASAGDISLDEAFFGAPHKKRESYAYRKNHIWRFQSFHALQVVLHQKHLKATEQPKKSLEQLAEEHLSSLFSGDDAGIDVDTFLRGYRRWKQEYRIND